MLWIPGPTEVRPEILAACAHPAIGHRTQDMVDVTERLDPGLRLAFGLAENSTAHVGVHTCSATGLMEMSMRGLSGRVLSVVNGAFSRRWFQIAGHCGLEAQQLEVTWGSAVDPEELDRTLREDGPFDAVTVVINETSTGVATPLASLKEVMKRHPNTLLLCDVVSYIAGAPIDFDDHGIDFALAGVQKAFALPPGLAVFCISERYLERAREEKQRGFYLDPVRILEGHEARKTPATPSTPLYFALAQQLEDITAGVTLPERDRGKTGQAAWQARFDKHTRMQTRTLEWAASHDTGPFPSLEHASPTVSCLAAGPIDVAHLVGGLKQEGFVISNGYGDLKGKTFRIGHMGDHTEDGLESLLTTADAVLSRAAAGS